MGSSSSKTTAKQAEVINERGGLHILEFHLPSASMGIGLVLVVMVIVLCTLFAVLKLIRSCRRQHPPPHVRSYPMVTYSSPSNYQWSQPHPTTRIIYADESRFEDITPSRKTTPRDRNSSKKNEANHPPPATTNRLPGLHGNEDLESSKESLSS